MSFPFFQKYSEILGLDLTSKEYDKKDLKLTTEEANAIYENTGCLKLEGMYNRIQLFSYSYNIK